MRAGTASLDARDWLTLLALLVFAAILGIATLTLRPELHAGASDILFSDSGLNLFVVERLLEGQRLYADVAFQYGPLPVLIHTGLAAILGNTLATYHGLLLGVSLLNTALAFLVVRRAASRLTALVVVGVGLTASFLIPGSLLGSFSVSSYVPFERSIILLVALLWTLPTRRTRSRALLLGLTIGSWQLVRFGGGAFLGIALVLADLLALYWVGPTIGRHLREYARSLAWTVGGAILVAATAAIAAFALLPTEVAKDTVWPSYVLGTYTVWVTPDVRWPGLGDIRALIGQYLTPLVGLASGLFAIGWYLRRRRTDAETPGAGSGIRLLIPMFFYLVAIPGYFRMAFHFFQFAWALVVPVAWGFERARHRGRIAILVLLLPCFALNFRSIFLTRPEAALTVVRTPKGEELWASAEGRAEIEELHRRLERMTDADDPSVLFVPLGAGFHHQFGISSGLRQPWLLGSFHRPYDDVPLIENLGDVAAVVFRNDEKAEQGRPCAGYLGYSLTPPTCREVVRRLEPGVQVGSFVVHAVRDEESTASIP